MPERIRTSDLWTRSATRRYTILIREWARYDNHQRYHEAIDNVTPADKYYGRDGMILGKREKVRKETMKMRRELNRLTMLEPWQTASVKLS